MRFQFLNFSLDTDRRELVRDGAPVRISPKNFDVLVYLVEHRDRMVPKPELMARFWSANTSEAALQKSISQLRHCLAAGEGAAEAIKTYHGRGFRFVAAADGPEGTPLETDARQKPLGETRSVTLLCALMTESAADAASSPQAVMDQAEGLVDRHGGELLQTLIDGFIASFGNAPVFEDSARLAAHCAWALAETDGPSWRIGLESGALPLDETARDGRWVLPGDLERGAARLAQSARPNEIRFGKAVLDHLQDEFGTEPVGEDFRLLSVGPMRTGIPARPRKRVSRYVGREPDLNFLQTQLDMAASGQGQAVALKGPPGIGKTRMVAEFVARLDEARYRHELVHCLPGLRNTPFAPLGALCHRLSDTPPNGLLRDDIDAALWRVLTDRPQRADAATLADLSDRRRQQLTQAVILRLLDQAAADKALVLVFEDVHWLDPASRALVALMLREAEQRAWMILITTRPVDTPPMTERVLQLAPLTRAESASLLEDAADGVDLSPDILQALVARADGNPFFIEELALIAASGGDPQKDVPPTVHAVIAARIGNLPLGMRQLLYVIAVLGTPADPGRVADLMKQSQEDIAATADVLIRMGFLTRDPRGYVFNHMLIDDTAYAMIDRADRRALHAEIADLIEASETPERPEHLAWHHQEAGNVTRAIASWTAASRGAIHRAAWAEAATFAENGLALVQADMPDADALELDLLLCHAPALIALRGFPAPEVGEAYRRASLLNRRVGNPKAEIRVCVGQWINTWVRGELTESLAHAEALVALSRKFPDPALVLQGHASRGQVLLHMGKLPLALEQLELGLAAIENDPPATPQAQNAAVSCAAYASWAASMRGDRDRAIAHADLSRDLAGLSDNPYAIAIHHALCLETFMFLGDVARCLDYADTAIRVSEENDYAFWLGTGLAMRGWCLGEREDYENALAATREGIRVFAETGAGVQLANWHGLHAEILLKSGDNQASLAEAQQALDYANAVGDIYYCPRIHSVAEKALIGLGRPQEAETEARRARDMAETFDMCSEAFAVPVAR